MSRRPFELFGGLENYERVIEFIDDPTTLQVILKLYEMQGSNPVNQPPKNPEKVITRKELCENCGIDIKKLSTILNDEVAGRIFLIYNCDSNGKTYNGIALNGLGVNLLEKRYKRIHKKLFTPPENPGHNMPYIRRW